MIAKKPPLPYFSPVGDLLTSDRRGQHMDKSIARKEYVRPEVTRVKLEDKQVVAMAACKTGPNDEGCPLNEVGAPNLIPGAS